ncbi:AMP-binding protein [Vibrio splendidus]
MQQCDQGFRLNPYQYGFYLSAAANPNQDSYVIRVGLEFDQPLELERLSDIESWMSTHPHVFSRLHFVEKERWPTLVATSPILEVWNADKALFLAQSTGISLEDEVLYRVLVAQTDQQITAVYFVFHHILLDQTGTESLIHHLDGVLQGVNPPVPQRVVMDSSEVGSETFWAERLAGSDTCAFEDPCQEPSEQTFGTLNQFLSDATGTKLETYCEANFVTPPMFFYGVLSLITSALQGADRVVVGTVVNAGAEINTHTTCYANPSVFALDWAKIDDLDDLWEQTTESMMAMLEHRKIPYWAVRQAFATAYRKDLTPPIFMSFAERNDNELGGFRWRYLPTTAPKFPLNITVVKQKRHYSIECDFDPQHFSKRYVSQLMTMVDKTIHTLLEEGSQASLLDLRWCEDRSALSVCSQRPSLIQRFNDMLNGAQRLRYVDDLQTVTSVDIQHQVRGLAAKLRAEGVEPGQRVLVEAVRDQRFVYAVLAIWQVGASFVPVESDVPQARLHHIEAQVEAQLFLASTVKAETTAQKITFDPEPGAYESVLMPAAPGRHAEAYVMFTSGSTGEPKGVAVSHDNIAHYADSLVTQLTKFAPESCMTQWTFAVASTLASDLGYTSIFAAMALGAKLTFLPKEVALDASRFRLALRQRAVDVLKITPSHLNALSAAADISTLLPKELLITGGEALTRAQYNELQRHDVRILNHYGPTETTVGVATWHDAIPSDSSTVSPLGCPLGDTRLWIMDHRRRALPHGVAGEIVVSGPGVSLGYVAQSSSMFFDLDGVPAYATGDHGWIDSKGCVHFMGRQDHQLKVNGHRVELAEIEQALSQYIPVSEYYLDYHRGSFTLFTLEHHQSRWEEIVNALHEQLPSYMLPSSVHYLSSLPLNATGKIDLSALRSQVDQTSVFDPSLVSVEPMILQLWEAHIGPPNSVHDSIYAQGANSIRALQLLAAITDATGYQIPLNEFLRNPRLSYFADRQDMTKRSKSSLQYVRSSSQTVTSMQQSMWYMNQLDPQSSAYNVPILIHLKTSISPMQLQSVIVRLTNNIEALSTSFIMEGQEVVCQFQGSRLPSIETCEFRHDREVMLQLAHLPFDINGLPPVRFYFDEGALLIVMHHIMTDNISNALILDALDELLGGADSLASVQFPAFRPEGISKEIRSRQDYWKAKLSDKAFMTTWPKALLEEPPHLTEVHADMEPDCVRQLEHTLRHYNMSTQAGLVSVFGLTSALHFNLTDMLMYIPITLRQSNDSFKRVGCGISTLPILVQTQANQTIAHHMQCLRDAMLEDMGHQDIEFSDLVEAAQLIDKNGRLRSNVLFTYEEEHTGCWSHFERQALDVTEPKFDLTVDVTKKSGGYLSVTARSLNLRQGTLQRLVEGFVHMLSTLEHIHTDTFQEYAQSLVSTPCQGPLVQWPSGSIRRNLLHAMQKHPDKIAVIDEGREYPYRELLQSAQSIAMAIDSKWGHDQPVIVYLSRSFYAVASMMAVVLSGRTLIPLDLSSPDSRIEAISGVLGQSALIDSAFLEGVSWHENLQLEEFDARNWPQNKLLYMIFTSGSTGIPKGVPIRDEAFYNYVSWAIEQYQLTADATVPLFTSLSYDLTLTSLFLPLICSASIDIIGGTNGVETLAKLAARKQYYQMVKMTPTHWSLYLQLAEEQPFKAGCLVLGGEQLHGEALAQLPPNMPIYNEYGPAETTVGCSIKKVYACESHSGAVSIGVPAPNCTMAVIGRYGQLLSEGVVGDLHIGGHQVFEGYIQRATPALRAHPAFDTLCYNSGDEAFFWQGEFHYVGRQDRQIKIDGHRIELGEVEHAILRQAGVISAQVEAHLDATHPQLIAIVDVSEQHGGVEILKQQLRTCLSAPMIPALYFATGDVVLSDSGKLDVPAMICAQKLERTIDLPDPDSCVRQIWVELLGGGAYSDHANFFDVGGNSKLLLQLCEALNTAFDIPVRPLDLLSLTTISQQNRFFSLKEDGLDVHQTHQKNTRRKAPTTDFLNRRKGIRA